MIRANLQPFHVVSIHAPVKGATAILSAMESRRAGFNPRSREGSDHHCQRGHDMEKVSIHAPVKGATRHLTNHKIGDYNVSIHAPVKGATR